MEDIIKGLTNGTLAFMPAVRKKLVEQYAKFDFLRPHKSDLVVKIIPDIDREVKGGGQARKEGREGEGGEDVKKEGLAGN